MLAKGLFTGLLVEHAPAPLRLVENVLLGPLIAVLSFVCSVGDTPLAAGFRSGGFGFAGVIVFIIADLIVLAIVVVYRKYQGGRFAVQIVALRLERQGQSMCFCLASCACACPRGTREARAASQEW